MMTSVSAVSANSKASFLISLIFNTEIEKRYHIMALYNRTVHFGGDRDLVLTICAYKKAISIRIELKFSKILNDSLKVATL